MESKEVIARIGKILKDNTAITEDEYIAVMNIFCENTFDYDIQQLYNNFEKTKYDYYIPENNPIYKIGIISLIAIIMHNIPEGMAIGVAFGSVFYKK